MAKNLYVDVATGDNDTTYANNDAAHPWASLIRATWGRTDGDRTAAANTSEAAQAGDTVYVTAGTYDYSGSFTGDGWMDGLYEPINSGTSGAWITFHALGTVNLTGNEAGVGFSTTIGATISQYIKWLGPFTMNELTSAWRNAMVAVQNSNIWIEGLVIVGKNAALGDNHGGIIIHGARDGDCTGGINNITIKNNDISGFTGDENCTGITLYCIGNNITIEHNYIHDNYSGIYGKEAYVESSNVNIRYNKILNNASGMRIQSFGGFDIYQNVFIDNDIGYVHYCNSSAPVGSSGPKNINFVNNTIDGGGLSGSTSFKFKSSCSEMSGNKVYNNIMTSTVYGIYVDSAECESTSNITTSKIDFNYNVYEHSNSSFFKSEGDGSASFATWVSGVGFDQDNVKPSANNVDCLYTNEAGNVFTLQAGSPCREGQANDGIDILNLLGGGTDEAITLGAYITGYEQIGLQKKNKLLGSSLSGCKKINGVATNSMDTILGSSINR